MQIIQEPKTIIKAEDGKVLRKKRDGRIVGDTVHLGYDYYEAGVQLTKPILSTPDDYEEIDIPEDYTKFEIINLIKRLKILNEIIEEEKKTISNRKLTGLEMLSVKSLFPCWGIDIKEGDTVSKGVKFQFKDKLYVVLLDITIKPYFEPNDNTTHIYKEITLDYFDLGTKENPIDYTGDLKKDNYYIQNGTIYLCIKDNPTQEYYNLNEFVGIYVKEISELDESYI